MGLATGLERRLEAAIDGLAARVFRGAVTAGEVAARLAREADLSEFETLAGRGTANSYVVLLHPADLPEQGDGLVGELENALSGYAAERGLRLEGPVRIRLLGDPQLRPGTVRCRGVAEAGPLQPWARLRGEVEILVGHNRALVGRGPDCDVVLDAPEVSRHHAILFRQADEVWVADLRSANGSAVDGRPLGEAPRRAGFGSLLRFANQSFRVLRCQS
ncbi:MAG TPA: DUF3662 and FHA domain-containing protein [Acidimicrobiia bacterium]|jgi:hypothetical protein